MASQTSSGGREFVLHILLSLFWTMNITFVIIWNFSKTGVKWTVFKALLHKLVLLSWKHVHPLVFSTAPLRVAVVAAAVRTHTSHTPADKPFQFPVPSINYSLEARCFHTIALAVCVRVLLNDPLSLSLPERKVVSYCRHQPALPFKSLTAAQSSVTALIIVLDKFR